jgi:16S rRNA (adenine1518-N6/adenine1519-N6)-dimethyltransferase
VSPVRLGVRGVPGENGSVLKHVTPSVAADLLSRHELRAGVRHGQHFLVDPNTVRRIVRIADIHPDETILEIGPGLGSLTVELADAAKRVVAVEIDNGVAGMLGEVLDGAGNVEVHVVDAMHADLDEIVRGPARLVANLPYNVATPLYIRVLTEFPQITGGLVMVQREIGERWTAKPSTRAYGSVTVRTSYHAAATIAGDVPRTVFMPPPKVASVLVAFTRHEAPPVAVRDEAAFFSFVQDSFAHRRKTLRNSLVASGLDRDTVAAAMDTCAIAERSRPEDLTLDAYARLHTELGP